MTDVLARAECDTAAIDLSLPRPLAAGETVQATVELVGGAQTEIVEGLELAFDAKGEEGVAELEGQTSTRGEATELEGQTSTRGEATELERQTSTRVEVVDAVRVDPGEHRVLGTEITLPAALPVSLGGTSVAVRLGSSGGDPAAAADYRRPAGQGVKDAPLAPDGGTVPSRWTRATRAAGPAQPVEIRPGRRLAQVLDAVSALGFFLESAVPMPGHLAGAQSRSTHAPIQEFRFRPRWGPYRTAGDLFLYPVPSSDRLEVGVVLVDTQDDPVGAEQGGPADPLETADRLTVRETDARTVRSDLRALVDRQANGT